jgi:hypothetical protein
LRYSYLQKACNLAVTLHNQPVNFGLNLVPLIFVVGNVPTRQSSFALSVLQQDEANLHFILVMTYHLMDLTIVPASIILIITLMEDS